MADMAQPAEKPGGIGKKTQTHRFTYDYYPEESWLVYNDPEGSMKAKYKRMSYDWLGVFGLKSPSEPTFRDGLATLCVANKMRPAGKQAYDMLQELKSEFKVVRDNIASEMTLLTFPRDPADFVKLYPNAYLPGKPPVPCRVDAMSIVQCARFLRLYVYACLSNSCRKYS